MNAGGVAAVVDYIGETKGNVRLPGIMMLGQSYNSSMFFVPKCSVVVRLKIDQHYLTPESL